MNRKRTRPMTHPGLLLGILLADNGLSVSAASRHLGVSRVTVSNLVNGNQSISAEMAIRLAQVFGGDAETWLRHQAAYDLWQLQHSGAAIKTKPLAA